MILLEQIFNRRELYSRKSIFLQQSFYIRHIEDAIAEGDLEKALAYANELEIASGIDNNPAFKYEEKLAPQYDKFLREMGKPGRRFLGNEFRHGSLDVRELRNLHRGQRCFIINRGTVPSEKTLALLRDEYVLGDFGDAAPRDFSPARHYIYAGENPVKPGELAGGESPVYFLPAWIPDDALLRDAYYLNAIDDDKSFIHYPFFSLDISRRIWHGVSGSYVYLQLARYLGFSEVNILGYDNLPSISLEDPAIIESAELLAQDKNNHNSNYFLKTFKPEVENSNRVRNEILTAESIFNIGGGKIINRDESLAHLFSVTEPMPQKDDLPAQRAESVAPERKYEISVIIPAYNTAKYLPRAIYSILGQYGVDCEIIIVDDESTDNTAEVASAFAERYANVKFFTNKKSGAGGARNKGLELATAPYALFLDGDDSMDLTSLLPILENIKKYNYDMVRFNIKKIENNKVIVDSRYKIINCGDKFVKDLPHISSLSCAPVLYDIKFLNDNNIRFEQIHHEDVLFSINAYCLARKVNYIDIAGYNYYINEDSVTFRDFFGHLHDTDRLLTNIKNILINCNLYAHNRGEYLSLALMLVYSVLRFNNSIQDIKQNVQYMREVRQIMRKHGLLNSENLDLIDPALHDYRKKLLEGLFCLP